MPRISTTKEDKIKESVLHLLFQQAPKAMFTASISQELARDEEYIKKLLLDLEGKKLVSSVKKNQAGIPLKKRTRWHLTQPAYDTYKKMQPTIRPAYDSLDFE
jgi:hypothetical protein